MPQTKHHLSYKKECLLIYSKSIPIRQFEEVQNKYRSSLFNNQNLIMHDYNLNRKVKISKIETNVYLFLIKFWLILIIIWNGICLINTLSIFFFIFLILIFYLFLESVFMESLYNSWSKESRSTSSRYLRHGIIKHQRAQGSMSSQTIYFHQIHWTTNRNGS